MDCGQWQEVLSAELDGETHDAATAERARAHTGTCPLCARWLAGATALRTRTRRETEWSRRDEPSPDLLARVLDALGDGRRHTKEPRTGDR